MAAKVKKTKQIRHKINRDELMEEYFEDMRCIGCVSTSPYYRFAHDMNLALDRDFRFTVPNPEHLNSHIIVNGTNYNYLQDTDSIRNIDYTIICNRNRTNYLLTELPKSDYIILMNGIKQHLGHFDLLIQKINEVSNMSYAFEFDPMSLKSMDYLVL